MRGGLVARNAYAAGREAGHADNDWNDRLCSAICAEAHKPENADTLDWFNAGYLAGRKEG